MTLTTVFGDVGTGKTLLTTYLALRDSRQVLSNYEIKTDRYKELQPQDIIVIDKPSLVVMDEAYLWLEARASMKNLNRYLSYMLFQSRKMKVEFLLTAQLFKTVDVRYREMSDYIILALREDDNIIDGDFIYKIYKNSNTRPLVKSVKICYDDAVNYIFPRYDTNQRMEIPFDLLGDAVVDKRDLLQFVDLWVDAYVHSKDYSSSFDKASVRDWAIRRDIPAKGVDLLYDALCAYRVKFNRSGKL